MTSSGRDRGRTRTAAALILLVVLAGGVRFGFLSALRDSPLTETPLGEAAADVSLAKSIAGTGSLGEEPLSRPPLYPMLLSLAVKSGDQGLTSRSAQAIGGIIVACLVFLAGRGVIGTAGGLLAGIFCALYGSSVHWDAQLMSASLMLCFFTFYWFISIRATKRRSLTLWLVAGLVLGLMAGMKTGALLLIVPALVLMLSRARSEGRGRSIAAIALLIVGAAVATSPFIAHNWKAGAPDIVIAADCGTEFFVANNPQSTGLTPGLAGEDNWWRGTRYAAVEASVKSGRELDEGETSRYWLRRGMGYIVRNPILYLKLLVRKLGHFWSRHEIDTGPRPVFLSKNWAFWSTPLMHSFALLGPLALAGLVLLRKRQGILFLTVPLIGSLLMALVFTAPSGTRLLALPSLALLSSATLIDLVARARARKFKATVLALGTLAVAAAVVNLAAPRISGVTPSEANDQRLLGVTYEIQGKGSLALAQYDRAKGMAPRNPACRLSLAAMLASDGVADEAERQFLTAAALDTLSPTPHLGLANLYRRNGLLEQSLFSLQAALERAPFDVGLLISVGRACMDIGYYEQAEFYLRNALSMDPENISAIDGLLELRDRGIHLQVRDGVEGAGETVSGKIQRAMMLLRQGDMDGARAILDEALESAPENLDLVFADATWYLTSGEPQKAIAGYERCHEHNPRNTIIMNNLAAAYQQTGRTDEAIAMWRRILTLDPPNAKAKSNLERVESQAK